MKGACRLSRARCRGRVLPEKMQRRHPGGWVVRAGLRAPQRSHHPLPWSRHLHRTPTAPPSCICPCTRSVARLGLPASRFLLPASSFSLRAYSAFAKHGRFSRCRALKVGSGHYKSYINAVSASRVVPSSLHRSPQLRLSHQPWSSLEWLRR